MCIWFGLEIDREPEAGNDGVLLSAGRTGIKDVLKIGLQ